MSLKTVDVILKVGRIFGFGPSKSQNFRKIYILAVFICEFYFISVAIVRNNFFKQDNTVRICIAYFIEIILLVFGFYVGIVLNFWKSELWLHLITSLANTPKVTKSDSITNFWFFNCGYVVLTVIYCSIWFSYIQWDFFIRFGFRELQLYFQFFYKLFLIEIIKLFLCRYKNLKYRLLRHLKYKKKLKNITPHIPLGLVRYITVEILQLKKLINIFNNLFGWPIALIIAFSTFQILNMTLFNISETYIKPVDAAIFFLIKNITRVSVSESIIVLHMRSSIIVIVHAQYSFRPF